MCSVCPILENRSCDDGIGMFDVRFCRIIFALYSLIRKYGAWLVIPAMLGGAASWRTRC